ncbi:hypothetical protein CW745_06385 [Psychromonas sp. psych-6C06]|uniref:hypothetical protein n=1 Tax=Psychromonas sp. psych-6C06 TaxID=2058089 RepID=UPI000C326F9A|nr:hypothetical protein [Psychromonas sp. psych-6C06]PKF63047.1 hypothetical protein CW745_06385 [Psychromonas sp. psych-6C06]
MAIFIKHLTILLCLLFSFSSIAHTIYAPNDIPLLDNRFRIDPEAEQVTFIFNHRKGYQRVVLVQPDGSKLYQQRHPESVAWVSSPTQDIVTVQKPMAGPWQAIAELDGDNRIKIISKVTLNINRLPLKLYAKEYITTHATLYSDGEIMTNPSYIEDTKLSVSLLGGANKKMALYQDDGKHYDELSFDGKLTARLYVDLLPGRYLLQISTKNDVFIRNVNKDAVVFISPIDAEVKAIETGSDEARITINIDSEELDPSSVSIDGVFKDSEDKVVSQVIMHNLDNEDTTQPMSAVYKLSHNIYTFSGKAYATTRDGREIELQLADRIFELIPPFVVPELEISEAISTALNTDESITDETEDGSVMDSLWLWLTIGITLLLIIVIAVIFAIKRKKKNQQNEDALAEELKLDELQPMPIDIKDGK